jgi:hypothetical protein
MIKFTKSYDENERVYYNFTTDKGEYYVPQYGIKVKIIDFEFATIPELNIVSVATKDRLLMFQRPSVDIILTLFWINRILVMKNNMNDDILNLFSGKFPSLYKNQQQNIIDHIQQIKNFTPTDQKEIDEERMNEEIMNMISKTTIIPQTNYITPSVMSPRIVETFDVPIWQKQGKINVIDVLPTSLSRQYSFIESRNPVNKTVNKTVSNGIQNNTSRKTAATKRKEVALNKQKNTQENHKVRKITKTTTIRKELIYACVERYYYDNFAKKSC